MRAKWLVEKFHEGRHGFETFNDFTEELRSGGELRIEAPEEKTCCFLFSRSIAGCSGSKPLGMRVTLSPCSSPSNFFTSAQRELPENPGDSWQCADGRQAKRPVPERRVRRRSLFHPARSKSNSPRRDFSRLHCATGTRRRGFCRESCSSKTVCRGRYGRRIGRLADIFRGESQHLSVNCAHQLDHRQPKLLLIDILSGNKPFAVIVILQIPQKGNACRRKTLKRAFHLSLFSLRYFL